MPILKPIDIDDALQSYINTSSADLTASAIPLPRDFKSHLPFVVFQQVGGLRRTEVIDNHTVACDVYANSWACAQSSAGDVVGLLERLAGLTLSNVQVYSVSFNLPYNNPDPNSPDTPRVSFNFQITTKTGFITN